MAKRERSCSNAGMHKRTSGDFHRTKIVAQIAVKVSLHGYGSKSVPSAAQIALLKCMLRGRPA